MLFGIALIIKAPDDYMAFNEKIYYTNATDYEAIALDNVYPLGILGSETQNGKEYTYYLICTYDASSTMLTAVLKTADSDFAKLFESQSPIAFEKTLYGKAIPIESGPKESYDEIVNSENLAQNYAIADWCFEDSMQNATAQITICVLSGSVLMIVGFVILIVFLHKALKANLI